MMVVVVDQVQVKKKKKGEAGGSGTHADLGAALKAKITQEV